VFVSLYDAKMFASALPINTANAVFYNILIYKVGACVGLPPLAGLDGIMPLTNIMD
jgi:hypothetical protein